MDTPIKIYNWDGELINTFLVELDEIVKNIPEVQDIELKSSENQDEWYIESTIQGGNLVNSYRIKVRIPENYLKELPYCFELSDNFPKTGFEAVSRHIVQTADYTKLSIKGSFCMVSSFRVPFVFKECPIDLYNTMNLLLIPHLENQEYFSKWSKFMGNDEFGYKHGVEGLVESFFEIFPTISEINLIRFLVNGKTGRIRKGNACFCGSGEPIESCHVKLLNYGVELNFDDEHLSQILISHFRSEIDYISNAMKRLIRRMHNIN